jgi:carbon-monoxide dehydrogenase medium subunit
VIGLPITYHAPRDAAEACELLADRGERAAVLGGGTWLVPMMVRGERRVSDVVDVRDARIDGIARRGDEVEVGAMATYSSLLASDVVRDRVPLLRVVAAGITGGAQIRNVGTVGGSACFAIPSSDIPACLVALGARMLVRGPDGPREIPADAFFVDAFKTALGPAELLAAIVVPDDATRVGYHKLKLCESSWPIATAAAVVRDGRATVAVGAVARTPLRLDVDPAAGGDELDALVHERLGEPWEDALAPGGYRRAVAGTVARRALQEALDVTSRGATTWARHAR